MATVRLSLREAAPTIVVAPCTYNVLLILASSVTNNLLVRFASLATVKLSLSEAAPTIVVAPCTYKVLFRLASFVTNKLLFKEASFATVNVLRKSIVSGLNAPETNNEPLNEASPITSNLLLNTVSFETVKLSLNDTAPTIVVAPWTYNVLFKLASLDTNNLLFMFASLLTINLLFIVASFVTVSVLLRVVAPFIVDVPSTYNVLFKLASFDKLKFPLIDKSSATINV